MKKKNNASEIKKLEKEIQHHNQLYFQKNKPEISDTKFDQLVRELKKHKPNSSVLSEIASDIRDVSMKEFKKVRHTRFMLSLDKCYAEEEIQNWADKFEGEVVASPKIDGSAAELRYNENGELHLGATRGDGVVGEDITANVRMIKDIPQKIGEGGLEIRGEIYMKLSIFKKFEGTFANPRNLAAGALKQKDPRKTRDYQLSFFGYDVLGKEFKTEKEKGSFLKKIGIPMVETRIIPKEEMQEVYEQFLSKRERHDFETDGVVFRANNLSEQKRLGFTAHHPRYSIAYKFQGDFGKTTLMDVEWSVARSGVITPVGIVEPVELSGATVRHVSLHNYGLMKKLGLRKGSKVLMVRSGGVIPKLESVVEAGRGIPFKSPDQCPSCGFPSEVREDFLYCTNPKGCRRTKLGELEHFIKVIDCDGFGEKLIARLYDNGFVKDPAGFFKLTKEDLLELERMGEVLATKLIGNLKEKQKLPLDLFLRSLGIRELAKHASKILVKEFKTLKRVLKVKEEELAAIHTIGPVIAKEVVAGLKKKRGLIERLLKFVSVVGARSPRPGAETAPLRGKTFLFTGSLLSMKRGEAENLVESKGGEIAGGVTKDLDYLVVGDGGGAGSKLEKAKKKKVKVVSETDWKKLIL